MKSYEIRIDEKHRLPEDATNVRTRRNTDSSKVIRFHSDTGPVTTDDENSDVGPEDSITGETDSVEEDPITGERRKTPSGWS